LKGNCENKCGSKFEFLRREAIDHYKMVLEGYQKRENLISLYTTTQESSNAKIKLLEHEKDELLQFLKLLKSMEYSHTIKQEERRFLKRDDEMIRR